MFPYFNLLQSVIFNNGAFYALLKLPYTISSLNITKYVGIRNVVSVTCHKTYGPARNSCRWPETRDWVKEGGLKIWRFQDNCTTYCAKLKQITSFIVH